MVDIRGHEGREFQKDSGAGKRDPLSDTKKGGRDRGASKGEVVNILL